MKISIAVAIYNGETYLYRTIRFQTRQPDEVIIVDDASADIDILLNNVNR